MKPRVLIIDDSLTVRMDLSEALELAGFAAQPTSDLQSARAALEREKFALVVLDVLLPDGDGIEFLSELKQSPATAGIPVMLLSTESQVQNRIRGLKTGADEYIGKPYDCSYVVARARELLRHKNGSGAADARSLILLIDDSPTFCEAITAQLEAAGYRVIAAASGEEGLHAAVNYRPAAVLVDSRLPGIDGTTVVRRLRGDAAMRRTPCLLLTASEESAEELRALEAGADGFARKDQDFSVVLARLAALLRAVSTPPALDEQSSFLGPKKILAIDDSITYLEELAANLRQEGYDVALAQSGEEGMELLSIQPMDCILLDVVMPGLSGTEVCRRIKSSPYMRDIPLLMITAFDEQKAMIEGMNAGADDYIGKSADFDVLRARIRAALRRKQVEDENRSVREQLLRKELEAREARARQELAETRAALLAELQASEQRVQVAAEAADLGIWYWDLKREDLSCTERFKALFGMRQETKPDYASLLQCVHPDDRARFDELLRQAIAEHQELENDYRVIWPDGSAHWIATRGRGLYDEADNPIRWTGVVMDVTERRRTQEALVRSEKLASVGRMAATMAHEINNPLEAVMNALFLLSCDCTLSSQSRANLDIAERELNRVAHITKQTLGFYRENSRPTDFHLSELMDDLLNLYSRKFNQQNIVVNRRWQVSGRMCGIPGEVRQIASNLISNAIDAVPARGTVHLRISGFPLKQAIRLTVADTGTGIRPEDLPCIFEPFFTTKKDLGTGLGLWVTKEIVEKHGGSIRVRSRLGKGTVFAVYLPLKTETDSKESGKRTAANCA